MAQEQRREETIKGVHVEQTGNKQWSGDYKQSDLESLFRRADFKDWGQVIQWLEKNGDSDNEFTPGETIAMKQDIQRLKDDDKPFSTDPDRVWQMTRETHH